MSSRRATAGFGLGALLLLAAAPTPRAGAQAPPEAERPHKSVYGKLESADTRLNGVFMKSNDGERLAWRFPAPVVAGSRSSSRATR